MKNRFYQTPLTEVATLAAQLTLLSGSPTPPTGDLPIVTGPQDGLNSL